MSSIMGGNYPGCGITLGPALAFAYIAARHLAKLGLGEEPVRQQRSQVSSTA